MTDLAPLFEILLFGIMGFVGLVFLARWDLDRLFALPVEERFQWWLMSWDDDARDLPNYD